MPTSIFLKMEFEQKQYMGFLVVNDAVLCQQLWMILDEHIGEPIEQIGELDVSCLL
jgi:hypothetical protein